MKELSTVTSTLALAILLLGRLHANALTTVFQDIFTGPTLDPNWQASLPTMYQVNHYSGHQPATYTGAPAYSFQTLSGAAVIRMTETNNPYTRRGWSTGTVYGPSQLHYEVRFNS